MAFEPSDPNFEARIKRSFSLQGFMDYIGAEITDIGPGYCEIQVPYKRELTQQHGFFHAGIIGTLADNSGGYAAFTLMSAHSSILTVEYKLNIMAPGDGETLIGRAQVIKPGRTLTICRPEVFVIKNGVRKLCATALMTLIELAGKPDNPV
jgi:uncharacterized protein (TIGR00369 family)